MRRLFFSPDGKSFNEVMAYVISLFFLILLASDPQMRSDLIWPITSRKFDSFWLELLTDLFLSIYIVAAPVVALGILCTPASGLPNVRWVRQDFEFIVLLVNLLSGAALTIHSYSMEASSFYKILIVVNGLIVLYEARALIDEGIGGADTSAGEMGAKHILCCYVFTVIFYMVLQRNGELYWAASLSMACTAAALFGFLLPLLAPLNPLGSRLEGATPEMLKAYQGEVQKELAEEKGSPYKGGRTL
ncbi:MAG: hypothetical protein J5J00_08995 [Deltaproteobacteria bacterium]|nr:hypothetical protein [Deltaproteobacteria bacterium]